MPDAAPAAADGPLGIIAGGGALPAALAEMCRSGGRPVFLVALEGHAEAERLRPFPHAWARPGAAGTILDLLRRAGVVDLVMAGAVRRPGLAELRPDWLATKLLARVGARALGDDGLLRAVAAALEQEGFRVVGVQDLLRDLAAPLGVLGAAGPDPALHHGDITQGVRVARTLGLLDIGQAVIVQQGLVLGVEAIEGTDALIDRCAGLRRQGPGPVLVKLRKPQQDRRLDLPTIGPATIERAARAGLAGVAVEAGGALIIDRARLVAAADAAGLFVVGLNPDDWAGQGGA